MRRSRKGSLGLKHELAPRNDSTEGLYHHHRRSFWPAHGGTHLAGFPGTAPGEGAVVPSLHAGRCCPISLGVPSAQALVERVTATGFRSCRGQKDGRRNNLGGVSDVSSIRDPLSSTPLLERPEAADL
jgi:hypothetical protein